MSKVLAIIGNPKTSEASYSRAVGDYFIKAYSEKNPDDQIVVLDVYEEDIPLIDETVFSGWEKLGSGLAFHELTSEESDKVGRLNSLLEQHISADKYVFVSPLWNFSLPPKMKAYIDAIAVAGKTFKYTEEGPVGLLTGRKALHIQASGGIYSEGPAAALEHGFTYIQGVNQFLGIPSTERILIEGTNMPIKTKEEHLETAYKEAEAIVATF